MNEQGTFQALAQTHLNGLGITVFEFVDTVTHSIEIFISVPGPIQQNFSESVFFHQNHGHMFISISWPLSFFTMLLFFIILHFFLICYGSVGFMYCMCVVLTFDFISHWVIPLAMLQNKYINKIFFSMWHITFNCI